MVSIQPAFLNDDCKFMFHRLSERAKHSYLIHSFIDKKIVVAAGSDSPTTNFSPFSGFDCALNTDRFK
jgi:predicted amidohydrolase YtcJ